MNWLFPALVTLGMGYKRKKKFREEEISKINYFMFAKVKCRLYSYVYMHEIEHYKKNKLFKCVNNIKLIFSRNAIMY